MSASSGAAASIAANTSRLSARSSRTHSWTCCTPATASARSAVAVSRSTPRSAVSMSARPLPARKPAAAAACSTAASRRSRVHVVQAHLEPRGRVEAGPAASGQAGPDHRYRRVAQVRPPRPALPSPSSRRPCRPCRRGRRCGRSQVAASSGRRTSTVRRRRRREYDGRMTELRTARASCASRSSQSRPADGDKERNLAAAGEAVAAAAAAGAGLVVLPEYALAGFPAERMRELAEPLDGPSLAAFRELAVRAGVCLVAGLPRLGAPDERLRHHGRHRAGRRPADRLRQDAPLRPRARRVHAGRRAPAAVRVRGHPLRRPVLLRHRVPRGRRAHSRCAARSACSCPAPTWSPGGRRTARSCSARALENHCFVAYANAVGEASGYRFEGESRLVDPLGRVLCDAERAETVVWADVDLRRRPTTREAVGRLPRAAARRSCTTDPALPRVGLVEGQEAGVKGSATSGAGTCVHAPVTPACCAPSSTCRRAMPKSMGAVQ